MGELIGTGGTAFITKDPIRAFVDIKIQSNPFLAWLVYRGELYSPNVIDRRAVGFSFAWYQFFRGSPWRDERYVLEKALEEFRKTKWMNAISRLDGFFLFPSEDLARQAERCSGFKVGNLLEVEIAPGARVSCYDMDWVSHYTSRRSEGNFCFQDYFLGNPKTSSPTWEYVVEGRARIVTKTDLATETKIVENFWPGYSQLLVSSKAACGRGDDGGAILPMTSPDRSELYFDIKEVNPKDPALSSDWNRLRSFVSKEYVFPVH
jgi:hypothetical protein